MLSLGIVELTVLVAIIAVIGGWRMVPRLLRSLQRYRLLRPDLAARVSSILRFFSGGR